MRSTAPYGTASTPTERSPTQPARRPPASDGLELGIWANAPDLLSGGRVGPNAFGLHLSNTAGRRAVCQSFGGGLEPRYIFGAGLLDQ